MKVEYYINEGGYTYKRIDNHMYYWSNERGYWSQCGQIHGGYTDEEIEKATHLKRISYEDLVLEMI